MHPADGLCDAAVIVVMGTELISKQTDCIVVCIVPSLSYGVLYHVL